MLRRGRSDSTESLESTTSRQFFNAFDSETRTQDIENLWRIFKARIALADNDSPENRADFTVIFDATLSQRGLGQKLTAGLYWIRPQFFINLDSRNRSLLARAEKIAQ